MNAKKFDENLKNVTPEDVFKASKIVCAEGGKALATR